ncbi:MAG: DNA polymerase III subunit delta [Atopobiaceae bacterium]|nr:DNA polymerase III subunit delta [Atopobiaceae bacterium]
MASSGLLPAYLVVGVDKLKRDRVIHRLKTYLQPGLEVFNLDEMQGSVRIDSQTLLQSLNTIPVGQGHRLVIIYEANLLTDVIWDTLLSYLNNPNTGCVLCLDMESIDGRTKKGKQRLAAFTKIDKRSVIRCDALKPRELPNHIIKIGKSLGITIDYGAAQELVSRVGEDTKLLDRTLRTLGEQCGPVITIGMVEANVARTAEVRPWEFLDKMVLGDARRALELYRHMPNPSHLGLLTMITRRMRELVQVRCLIDRGKRNTVASEIGKQEWQVRDLLKAANRYSQSQLYRCLSACAECERELKGGSDDEEAAFIKLVLFICNASILSE